MISNWSSAGSDTTPAGKGTIYSDKQGNVFAPMYIIEDTKSFPRAVDADGIPHHDAVSDQYQEIVERAMEPREPTWITCARRTRSARC